MKNRFFRFFSYSNLVGVAVIVSLLLALGPVPSAYAALSDLDTTFNPSAGVSNGLTGVTGTGTTQGNAVIVQPDGKIVVAGNFASCIGTARASICRFNADGSLDATFSGLADDTIHAMVRQPADGKLIIVGSFSNYGGVSRPAIARLNTDGTLDASFTPGAGATTGVGGATSTINAIALQPDGKVIIAGAFTAYNGVLINRIARINADGSLDSTFDPNSGGWGTGTGGLSSTGFALHIQSNGQILVAGQFTSCRGVTRRRLCRLNSNGTLDAAFNTGANATSGATGGGLIVYSIAQQSDNQILIGGNFTTYDGVARNNIARVNYTDGTIDASFNPGTGTDNDVRTIYVQSTGNIVFGGAFLNYNGTGRVRIARVDSTGALDATFNPGTGPNSNSVKTIRPQPDGKLVLAGTFTQYQGVLRNRIVRIGIPEIAVASPAVAPAYHAPGTTDIVVYSLSFTVTEVDTSLSSLVISTAGTYQTTDLAANSFKLRYSTNSVLDAGDATLSTQAVVASGGSVTFGGLSQTITAGSTVYVFVTVDFAALAVGGRTISVNAVPLADITFSSGNKSGATSAGGVQTVGSAPAITSANATSFTVFSAGSFTVTTTGIPTPSISETGALPAGVTFVDNGDGTGTLSGTPSTGTVGTYPITFTASNGISPNATQNFTLTVNKANQTITITTNAPATAANGTNFTVAATASSGLTVTYSSAGVCTNAGATFTMTSGAGTCTVQYDQAGNADYNPAPQLTESVTAIDVLAVASITRASPNPTNAASVDFTLVFNRIVTGGLDSTDFVLTVSGVSGASITNISGSGTTYTVSVNTGSGDGTIRLDVTDDDTIVDASSNPLGGPGAGNGNYSMGEVYTVDKTGPTVTSTVPANGSLVGVGPTTLSVTFNEGVVANLVSNYLLVRDDGNGFQTVDCAGGALAGDTAITVNGVTYNGATFTTTLNINGGVALSIGTYRLFVCGTGANPVTDIPGNKLNNGTSDTLVTFVVDSGSPTVTSSVPANGATVTSLLSTIRVTFSEDVVHDGSANAADSLVNYLLVEQASNKTFDTTSCNLGLAPGDVKIVINSVSYDAATYSATLSVNGGTPLSAGIYRLFVCGTTSITDMAGNKLNGGLSDSTITFTIPAPASATASALPASGFAPGVKTNLPVQDAARAYSNLGDLWLEIPSLGAKISIIGVPLVDGTWDVSWLWNQAGYLQGTAFPTWNGNSVITGHVYLSNGKPGPFLGLPNLKWGDQIIIHLAGKEYIYEVRTVKTVLPNDVNSVITHEKLSWITLLTCRDYDAETGTYRSRTVIRAVLVQVK